MFFQVKSELLEVEVRVRKRFILFQCFVGEGDVQKWQIDDVIFLGRGQ